MYPESAVEIDGKMIYKSKISLKLNDTLILRVTERFMPVLVKI